ncbi:hypothetical protein B0H15DRAFT_1001853, partial [Mycena belliarum]
QPLSLLAALADSQFSGSRSSAGARYAQWRGTPHSLLWHTHSENQRPTCLKCLTRPSCELAAPRARASTLPPARTGHPRAQGGTGCRQSDPRTAPTARRRLAPEVPHLPHAPTAPRASPADPCRARSPARDSAAWCAPPTRVVHQRPSAPPLAATHPRRHDTSARPPATCPANGSRAPRRRRKHTVPRSRARRRRASSRLHCLAPQPICDVSVALCGRARRAGVRVCV